MRNPGLRRRIFPVFLQKRDITRDFTKVINADTIISTEITDNIVLLFEQYLIDMDLLSAINKKEFRYTDEFGWLESPTQKEFYIIQPAIKYHHLQKGKEFIENEVYYQTLPQELKNKIQKKLDENIKGDMIKQIIIFDVSKELSNSHYFVCKPEFYINGQKKGEYDMLIYDNEANKYWAFEIKHTTNPHYKQEQQLQDPVLKKVIDSKYGNRENVCVLYRGNPFISSTGTLYFNITDFLVAIKKYKDVDIVFNSLSKSLSVKDISRK